MCLLIFAHQISPEYPLLVAANRDEFHARPTAPADWWPEHTGLLAGRDLASGGTWMGVTGDGRFAAVTNFRDPARSAPAPRSRGELPLNFLRETHDAATYLNEVAGNAASYAGFNLLVGDEQALWYFTNSDNRPPLQLPPGLYGLSNATLDTPWPKVLIGKDKLQALLDTDAVTHDALAAVVSDRQQADPGTLLDSHSAAAMEALLSAQFIVTDSYGTRSTTTLWQAADGSIDWREQSFDARGALRNTQQYVVERNVG
jgi:uncharacterized protein with NRDE domain